MAVKRRTATTRAKTTTGKAAPARRRSRASKKGGSFIMTAKKTSSEKKGKVMEKAKALFRSGKERVQAVDLGTAVDAVGRGAEKATAKALILAKRMSVQYKISEQRRKLQSLLAELGGRVYDITKRNPQALSANDPDIMKLAGKIRDAEKTLMALEETAGALKNREGAR